MGKEENGQLPLDIYRDKDKLIIIAPAAGVSIDDLSVTVTDDVLKIEGAREFEKTIEEENYFSQECFWGKFTRSVVLPVEVDTKKIEASFKNGVLKITAPITEEEKTKIVKIITE